MQCKTIFTLFIFLILNTSLFAFEWLCHPEAEILVQQKIEEFILTNPELARLEKDLFEKTSNQLFDLTDHIVCPFNLDFAKKLLEVGFTLEDSSVNFDVYSHLGAKLPAVLLNKQNNEIGIAVLVESIGDFQLARNVSAQIQGTPFSSYRRSCINEHAKASIWVVERRGSRTVEPKEESQEIAQEYLLGIEKWKSRPRAHSDELLAYDVSLSLAQDLVNRLGQARAACAVLEVERQYWQSRNKAGQLQKNRQDQLGIGWANHDHHTFRSSRCHFTKLIHIFEVLGFHCRERFYAGKDAGWGAQVMENPEAGLVLFLDVDLAPDEILTDFSHEPLVEKNELGTIGLWCALHGDSFLQAGMHHLEAQFLFDHLQTDLKELGISMMKPFSDFPYLKQAFTTAEIWKVDPKRIEFLVNDGKITDEQALKFLAEGAIGSHLENLQRRYGFKGFNSKNVSDIIRETDPRN